MTRTEIFSQGGAVLWIIVGCSLLGMYFTLERWLQLRRATIAPRDFLEGLFTVLRRGNIEEAVSICEDTPGPIANVTRAAILHYDEPEPTMRAAIQEAGFAEIPRLERNLDMLLGIAHIAPILGLFGTVLGLMQAFYIMQQRSPLIEAADLSGGIWQALITSAAGLVVAIPLYAVHALLSGKVRRLIQEMDRSAAEIMKFLLSRQSQPRGVRHEPDAQPV